MIFILAVTAFSFLIVSIFYLRWSITPCESRVTMRDKVVIVTGANAGIGFYTALDLARRGARVILACRDEGRGTAAQRDITSRTGNTNVLFKHLDLTSLKCVRQFAADILQTEDRLHILVNNAGVYGFARSYTEDGITETMQINYYGHYLLTLLLLPLLKKSQPSRIINLSSNLHFFGCFDATTVNEQGLLFNDTLAYCNSKFCMLLFSIELARRLKGSGVVANAAHPGVIMTGISTYIPHVLRFLFWCWSIMYSRSSEQGAQTIIHLAIADECAVVSGNYFVDCSSRIMSWNATESKAKELWDHSSKLVGIEMEELDFELNQ